MIFRNIYFKIIVRLNPRFVKLTLKQNSRINKLEKLRRLFRRAICRHEEGHRCQLLTQIEVIDSLSIFACHYGKQV